MRFSPLLLSSLIIEPLKYFFSQGTRVPDGLYWDPDEKVTTIEIGTVNDFHNIPVQLKPRVIVNRGNYTIRKSALTDNLAESRGIKDLFGKSDRTNMVWVDGAAQIIIETSQEGTCELIVDMVTHFIAGTSPIIANTMGFKEFGLPMSISSCDVDKEDVEKFKVVLTVPYMFEDHWRVTYDALKFKSIYVNLINKDNPQVETPILITQEPTSVI